jgi:hypothetical protein
MEGREKELCLLKQHTNFLDFMESVPTTRSAD